jgi:hypothetical protein
MVHPTGMTAVLAALLFSVAATASYGQPIQSNI